mgnify:CR=1 FL=1
MRQIFVLFLIFISILGFSQDKINQLDDKGNRHGLWRGTHKESNRIRYEGTFYHGKETGVFKYFDDTKAGIVIATRDFSKGDGSCNAIFYDQKGNKVSEGKLVNKLPEGEWKYYHENSPQVMTLEYYSNGKLNGVRKVFYKSGVIAEETTYKDGVKEGLYKSYAENGIVLEESNFKNGLYDGMATYRTATNELSSQGVFKSGKKVGIWKILEKGKLKDVNMDKQRRKFQKRVKPLEEN